MEVTDAPIKELTALERKWRDEVAAKQPTLDDAYTETGFAPDKLHEDVVARIP